ncbi:hypothetical protein DPMN_144700 [Dreissena polymorpha]|uniref:Uncharacterized protein n=1 Tax=Dreissena polymorpha TaxID=45954 RepID=A0A9D4F4L1_DREPO|nr:hypothetical protein DPMN_144700 [Dreissena polymorpha]
MLRLMLSSGSSNSRRLPTQASEECVDSHQFTQEPVTTDDEAGEFEPDPLSEPQPSSVNTILGTPSAPNKAKKPAAVPNQKPGYLLRFHPAIASMSAVCQKDGDVNQKPPDINNAQTQTSIV